MNQFPNSVFALASFAIIVLASASIGCFLAKLKLAVICGFLFVGVLAGPYALQLVAPVTVERVTFLEGIVLGVNALAAGSELHLQEARAESRVSTTLQSATYNYPQNRYI